MQVYNMVMRIKNEGLCGREIGSQGNLRHCHLQNGLTGEVT